MDYLPLSIFRSSGFIQSIIPCNKGIILIEDVLPLLYGISFQGYESKEGKTSYSYCLYKNLDLIKHIFLILDLIIDDNLEDIFIDYFYFNIMIDICKLLLLDESVLGKIRKCLFRNLILDDNHRKLKEFNKNHTKSWEEFKASIVSLMKQQKQSCSFWGGIFVKKIWGMNLSDSISREYSNQVPIFNELIKYYQGILLSKNSSYLFCSSGSLDPTYTNLVYGFLLNF